MKIGELIVTPNGLELLAKAIKTIGGKSAKLEVHKDDDSQGVCRVCLLPEAG